MLDKQASSELGVDGEGFQETLPFTGVYQHSLDSKGRVSLPVQFRNSLLPEDSKNLILTNYISNGTRVLEGYALSKWNNFRINLKKKSRFDPKLQKLENYYIARACECSIDNTGRILIPSYLREYAGIDTKVCFTASLSGFRLWDKRVWELVFSEAEAALLDDPSLFKDVDL